MPKTVAAAVLFAALLAGPVSGLPGEPEHESGQEPKKDEIDKPLSEIIAGKRDLKTLRIEVTWIEGHKRTSARLHGSGVGIWNDRVQVRVPRNEILSIASAIKDARFGAMPSQLGEESDKLKLIGKMTVSIAGKTKGVVQLADGEESKEFSALAARVLDLVGKRSKTGVTASSLADALAKLSAGALAPEALHLISVRRPEKPEGGRGWLLHMEGREAVGRPFARGGYGNERRLEVSDAEIQSVIGALRGSNAETFPPNLYAADYTELRIEVLQWTHDSLARRSANVTQETHGERQKAFDRVIELVARLEERVEKDGREEPGP